MSLSTDIKMMPCTINEYPMLLDKLDQAFGMKEKHWFVGNVSHLYPPIGDENIDKISKNYLLKKDNDIAGGIGIFPLKLEVQYKNQSFNLSVGGIGSVFTDAKYRNQGVMSMLLPQVINKMEEDRYDFSWLTGNRYRYRNYGWDFGGKQYCIHVNQRDLLRYDSSEKRVDIIVPTEEDIDTLKGLYAKYTCKVVRDDSLWEIHLKRKNLQWVMGEVEHHKGYLVFYNDNPELIPELQGDYTTITKLLIDHMQKHNIDHVEIKAPFENSELVHCLKNISCNFSIKHIQQIKLINSNAIWNKLNLNNHLDVKDDRQKELLLLKALDSYGVENDMKATKSYNRINWWMSSIDMV